MEIKAADSKIKYIEKLFIVLLFLYAVLGSNNLTYGSRIITPVMLVVFIIGGSLILYRVFHIKEYKTMTGFLPAICMFASICLSTIVNYRYSLRPNLVFCIYWSLFFFVLYFISDRTSIRSVGENIEFTGVVFLIYITFAVIVSFYMFANGTGEKLATPDGGYDFYRGFAIGRLWGMFINPNNSAVSAGMTVLLLIYFFGKCRNVISRLLIIADIVLMTFFIALTDSRTGAVALGISVFFYCLVSLVLRVRDRKERGYNGKAGQHRQGIHTVSLISLAIIIALVAGFAGYALPRQTKQIYNRVNVHIARERQKEFETAQREKLLNEGLSEDEIELIIAEELENEDFGLNTVERGYDLKTDVSNRRIDAWKSAAEIFVSSPKAFIIGTSFCGFTEYALENLPHTYVVNNDYGLFTTLDNEIFNIMDAQGIIGLGCLLWLVASILIALFGNIFNVRTEYRQIVAVLTGICFGLAGAAMFSSVMFYHFSQNTVLFWVSLGSLIYIVKNGVTYEN